MVLTTLVCKHIMVLVITDGQALCVCVFVWFFLGRGEGGGGRGPLTFRKVVEKKEYPDFRSLEVGILI